MAPRALVQNAGSERQVRRAQRKEREYDDRLLEALRATLATPHGRVLVYELLREARVYGSVWHDHGSRMAFNVGQQDFGHWILAQAIRADENLVSLMEREGRSWQMKEQTETAAAQDGETEGATE